MVFARAKEIWMGNRKQSTDLGSPDSVRALIIVVAVLAATRRENECRTARYERIAGAIQKRSRSQNNNGGGPTRGWWLAMTASKMRVTTTLRIASTLSWKRFEAVQCGSDSRVESSTSSLVLVSSGSGFSLDGGQTAGGCKCQLSASSADWSPSLNWCQLSQLKVW